MKHENPTGRAPLTDAQRVITRTWSKINNGKARGWSLAMAQAAETLKKPEARSQET